MVLEDTHLPLRLRFIVSKLFLRCGGTLVELELLVREVGDRATCEHKLGTSLHAKLL